MYKGLIMICRQEDGHSQVVNVTRRWKGKRTEKGKDLLFWSLSEKEKNQAIPLLTPKMDACWLEEKDW